jgi:hypothetical protein
MAKIPSCVCVHRGVDSMNFEILSIPRGIGAEIIASNKGVAILIDLHMFSS